jgi:hypothetical protein
MLHRMMWLTSLTYRWALAILGPILLVRQKTSRIGKGRLFAIWQPRMPAETITHALCQPMEFEQTIRTHLGHLDVAPEVAANAHVHAGRNRFASANTTLRAANPCALR